MSMEKRNRQNLTLLEGTQTILSGGGFEHNGTALPNWKDRISLAAQRKGVLFDNILCHIKVATLREAYDALDGTKAVGIDGISKKKYGENLEVNLKNLENRIHKGSYKPQEKREVLIPKADGKMRPIAISCFEDKLVEWVVSKILQCIYEPTFIDTSFGFRPFRSTDGAIQATYQSLKDDKRRHVVEIDFAKFFNSIPHRKLMKILGKRVTDRRFKGLVGRFLKVGILEQSGLSHEPDEGTPQGSIMSPILANVYLHEVLDTWFLEKYSSQGNTIVRYADDAIFFFGQEEEAIQFMKALYARVKAYGLSLNSEKTGIVYFGKDGYNSFSFLNFTFYWDKQRGKLRLKTRKETLHKKIREFYLWIKNVRSKMKLEKILKLAKAKIQGHYNYYGFWMNRARLNHFFHEAIKSLYKWLNRRSQKSSFNWEEFQRLCLIKSLPVPPPLFKLKPLGENPYV